MLKKIRFLTLLAGLLLAGALKAQTVAIEPNYADLPPACVTQAYNFQLFLNSGATATWLVSAGALPDGLTLELTTGIISGTPDVTAAGSSFSFTVQATASGTTYTRSYDLAVQTTCATPCPGTREYALLLDLSGSMTGLTASGSSKWDLLKSAVSDYLPLLKSSVPLGAGDKLGVYTFNGESVTQLQNTNFGQAWINNPTSVENTLFPSTLTPSDLTPMGGGIQHMFNSFFSSLGTDAMRSIIVFTDGMQNKNPMFNEMTEVIENQTGFTPASGILGTTGLPLDVDSAPARNNHVKIFTIGVGAAPGFATMLNKLANPDNEYVQIDYLNAAEQNYLNVFFTKTIPSSLRFCSPRVLDYRRGTMTGFDNPPREKFRLNAFVSNLAIRVDYPDGLETVKLYKDGQQVNVGHQTGKGSTLVSVPFPYTGNQSPDPVAPAGEWELEIIGKAGRPYNIVAITNDELLKTDLRLGSQSVYYPGNSLPVVAEVGFGGKHLAGATVTATLIRPGDDLGDLAAKSDASGSLTLPEPGYQSGQAKIDNLLRDPAFLAKIQRENRQITLTDDGAGHYTGSFTGNQVTGTYQVYVRFKGTIPGGTAFEGWEMKCALYDFSEQSGIRLNGQLISVISQEGGPFKKLVIRPTNKFNRMLGPGQLNRINVQVDGVNQNLTDNLDGTYSTPTFAGTDPNIKVFVIDQQNPVFDGPASQFDQPWEIAGQLGITIPQNGLGAYNNGIYGQVSLGRRIAPNWQLQLTGGYYGFKSDFNIAGASLTALFTNPALAVGPFDWRLGAGVGYYAPKGQSGAFGLVFRGGLRKAVGSNSVIGLEGAYVTLPDPVISFYTVGLEWSYKF